MRAHDQIEAVVARALTDVAEAGSRLRRVVDSDGQRPRAAAERGRSVEAGRAAESTEARRDDDTATARDGRPVLSERELAALDQGVSATQ